MGPTRLSAFGASARARFSARHAHAGYDSAPGFEWIEKGRPVESSPLQAIHAGAKAQASRPALPLRLPPASARWTQPIGRAMGTRLERSRRMLLHRLDVGARGACCFPDVVRGSVWVDTSPTTPSECLSHNLPEFNWHRASGMRFRASGS